MKKNGMNTTANNSR